MENLDKKAFISTTFDSYKEENLENLQKETKKRNEQIKSFTFNSNKIIQLISLVLMIIFLFFILPLLITGYFTKGMTIKRQISFVFIILIIICIHIFKKTIM